MDVLFHVKDKVIGNLRLNTNSMTLISLEEADRLYAHMPSAIARSGGSAANTTGAFAALGGKAGYVGRGSWCGLPITNSILRGLFRIALRCVVRTHQRHIAGADSAL